MKKIIQFLTLKHIFGVGLVSSILSIFLYQRESKHLLCGTGVYGCYDYINFVLLLTMFFGTFFVFSCVFFLVKKDKVFASWKRFTSIYFLIYLFFIILVPWNWGDVFLPIYKGTVALVLSVFYFLISLILIIFKSIQLRNKN
ncbi:MAG: hypothetical protein ACKOW9_02770 [Candidatus Paceibacterota bacterium]